uniref:Uncharacterized protein n=1 Tax=Chrysemys picta bellii TaxID=8478 RepID=A0A8C3IE90_CHRPI
MVIFYSSMKVTINSVLVAGDSALPRRPVCIGCIREGFIQRFVTGWLWTRGVSFIKPLSHGLTVDMFLLADSEISVFFFFFNTLALSAYLKPHSRFLPT